MTLLTAVVRNSNLYSLNTVNSFYPSQRDSARSECDEASTYVIRDNLPRNNLIAGQLFRYIDTDQLCGSKQRDWICQLSEDATDMTKWKNWFPSRTLVGAPTPTRMGSLSWKATNE